MSIRIKKISIHAFRGIPELELEIDEKSLLLRGENGTGKSSIVEAIEFFFTGEVSHLERVQGLSLRRHGPHVNFTPDDVKVEMIFNPSNISLNRNFASVPSPPGQFNDYFQITQKGTFILRRSQILEFIMSQPAERFRAIGSIIGIEPLDNVELEMMRLSGELKEKVTSKKDEIDRLIKDLSGIMGKDIAGVEDVLPALNETLQKANLPPIRSLEEVDKHAEEMLRTVKKAKSMDKIGAINEILKITDVPFIPQEVISRLEGINEKIKYLLQGQVRVELSVAGLLESGREVIEQEKIDICPLCEQKIDRERLLSRINDRLKAYLALSEKASEIRKETVPVIDNLRRILDKLQSVISQIEIFPELSEEKDKLVGKVAPLKDCIKKIESAKALKNEIPIQEIKQLQEEINKLGNSISVKCKKLLDDIGLTEEEKRVLKVIRLIEQARTKVKDISTANFELQAYLKYYKLAEKIYITFSETKKSKIQEVYNAIQGDIQRFYSMLHPNELHRNIELIVALGRRASTELKIDSFGRERRPESIHK